MSPVLNLARNYDTVAALLGGLVVQPRESAVRVRMRGTLRVFSVPRHLTGERGTSRSADKGDRAHRRSDGCLPEHRVPPIAITPRWVVARLLRHCSASQ